jgi:ribonuclease HII
VVQSAEPETTLEDALARCGNRRIAGVDEVGRGSWAGPVVAAAVVLPLDPGRLAVLGGVRDSKLLTAQEREGLFPVILETAVAVGLGWASHHAIDGIGLVEANRQAMLRAIRHLGTPPDALLVDAVRLPDVPIPQVGLPKGERRSISIAAASIVAKVMRDRWMVGCDTRFPGYGFANHKGYGTLEHRVALHELGVCPAHRRSFRPIADLVA